MDQKISGKDTVIAPSGQPETVDGMDEIVQRVKIACGVRKGAFIYDRALGVDLDGFDPDDEHAAEKLEMLFEEAAVNIPDVSIRVKTVKTDGKSIKAETEIRRKSQTVTTEVETSGEL